MATLALIPEATMCVLSGVPMIEEMLGTPLFATSAMMYPSLVRQHAYVLDSAEAACCHLFHNRLNARFFRGGCAAVAAVEVRRRSRCRRALRRNATAHEPRA